MNGDPLSILLWHGLAALAILLAVAFAYMYRKDRDIRKLMFTLAFAFASLSYIAMPTESGSTQTMERLHSWSPLPTLSAVLITVLSGPLKLKDFDKPFKTFLFTLVASIFFVVAPIPVRPTRLFQGMSTIIVAVSIYLYLAKRELSDLMFLLSMTCFISGSMGITRDLGIEFTVFTFFFAYVFIALVFATSKESVEGGIASFFTLKTQLDKTREELRISREKLVNAERLAAIGELAAMVGHDLRNPLTSINTAAYYLKKRLASNMSKETREILEIIQKSVKYSDKIINDLLEYSTEIQLELTETTPKSLVRQALHKVEVPDHIEMLDFTLSKTKMRADVKKMERAFVNIIKNAVDAMPKGGTLTIRSKEANGNLKISFFDTGIGMSKDVVEKIWKPLFTTKAKGMGFGLAICKRIVEAHEGEISVESTVGKGTVFTLKLPTTLKTEGAKISLIPPEPLSLSEH